MKKKINKKRLNVLKVKNKLNNLMYFFLEAKKTLKQEILLKSTIKSVSSSLPFFDSKKLRFPVGIQTFENTNDTIFSATEDINFCSVTLVGLKNSFFNTTKGLYLVNAVNNYDNFIQFSNRLFLFLKFLNYNKK